MKIPIIILHCFLLKFAASASFFAKEFFFFKGHSSEVQCHPKTQTPNILNISDSHQITFINSDLNDNFFCFEQITNSSSRRSLETFNCSLNTCPNGMCDTLNRCFCQDKYTTFQPPEGVQCNYKQKSRYGALLLEFFFGMETGAGYFYLGYVDLGIGQLILFFPSMIVICILTCCFCESLSSKRSGILACCRVFFVVLWTFGSIAWWLYAVIAMGSGDILESNGAPTGDSVYI